MMKKRHKPAFFLLAFSLLISCTDQTDEIQSENNENPMSLNKIVSNYYTNGVLYSRNVKHYTNNEVVADTTLTPPTQWMYRSVILTSGLTKTYNTYDTNGDLTESREKTYDSSGRLTGRRDIMPPSALTFSYTYNQDNTITSSYYNSLDQQTTVFRTYYKNNDGIIYKEFDHLNNETCTMAYEGQKPISMTYLNANITYAFNYFPNPKPSGTLKSANQLNNEAVLGNSLLKLAENGNYYYRGFNNSNSINCLFDSNNYLTSKKYTSVNTNVTPNTTNVLDILYYYN
ncbi:hypothetical protein [Flavobacterium humi]|uniref:DUF4595 domain-containing protein n=1 Tax=Flavobacterium humi TaxID=2562683 RepID=A0A4Z0L5H6_9FLAO|nr:hypothetical protein [Flavobacterium humi]TGD56958.1 hypothetical protein E4635_14290 [Flavobacterium humi]